MTTHALSELDKRILEFGAHTWNNPGLKEDAIRELFGMSATTFYQRLNAALDHPEALAHDPITVNRLRRIREQRRDARSLRSVRA